MKRAARGAASALSDGRVQRGERSREAIIAAMFALVGQGALEPTAERVAARARVGLRSVFRHFADMESLYAALDARLSAEIAPLLAAGEPLGDAAQRARALVARRARLFERIRPFKRAANFQRKRSPFLDARHRTLVALLRSDLLRWLPEARALGPARAAALELATSFEAWERLREDQRLSAARTRSAVLAAVLALVGSSVATRRRGRSAGRRARALGPRA